MRIYLSPTKPEEKTHQWVSNIAVLNGVVEDCEATSIVCDNFLSTFTQEELVPVMAKILSKMRLNCELIIVQPDIEILAHKFGREEISLEFLNDALFRVGAIKSVTSAEQIRQALPEVVQITHQNFDVATSTITIKAKRVQ